MKQVLLIIFLTIFFFSCSPERGDMVDEGKVYSDDLAKVVSFVPSGLIELGSDISLFFVNDMVDEDKVGIDIKKDFFVCTPEIKGVTKFVSKNNVKMFPEKRLEKNAKYECKVDIYEFFREDHLKKLPVLTFSFETPGLEIVSITGEFKLKKEDDPKNLYYEGSVIFNDQVDKKWVEEALEIKKNGKKTGFSGEMDEADKRKYNFKIPDIVRRDEIQKFVIKVERTKNLDIADRVEKPFELNELQKFAVESITPDISGSNPVAVIQFSDEISKDQDIEGLITVSGYERSPRIIKNDKRLIVSADFKHGEAYTITVNKGIRSVWGTVTTGYKPFELKFEDIKPQISFVSDGVYLPSSNRQSIRFKTVNLKNVNINVKKVYENNLLYFLQEEKLESLRKNNSVPFRYSFDRVGVEIDSKKVEIGETRNRWLAHEIDLSPVFKNEKNGLYVVTVNFDREDMLYKLDNDKKRRHYGSSYYSDPNSRGYIYRHGSVTKSVILSDIGVLAKIGKKESIVYATDLISAQPLSNVQIIIKSYQNQIIANGVTDGEGKVIFNKIPEKAFLVEAVKGENKSFVKLNDMNWNLSSFDTGGVKASNEGIRGFVYPDRGVYRPGDTWNIGLILRNEKGTFPDKHPVKFEVYNPKSQLVYEKNENNGKDGFYVFTYATGDLDFTGDYRLKIKAGTTVIDQTIKVETVAPYKLKVSVEPDIEKIEKGKKKFSVKLNSQYLAGNPANNHDATLTANYLNKEKKFKNYKDFVFDNEFVDFKEIEKVLFKGFLNNSGDAFVTTDIPEFKTAPSAIEIKFTGRVLEKGGRAVTGSTNVSYDPWETFIGIKVPDFKWGTAETGIPVKVKSIAVDKNGSTVSGNQLNVTVYKGQRYWWYEYSDFKEYKKNFKSMAGTEIFKQFSLISKSTPQIIEFVPEESGSYLVEVQDGSSGHTASVFIRVSAWGDTSAHRDASVITPGINKERFKIGEKAEITIPSPQKGRVLFTVEKGSEIIESRWLTLNEERELKIPFVTTKEMVPNVYATVSVIQPHAVTANDRPLRMYGVVPVFVDDPDTKQNISIEMADTLKPEQLFTVKVDTGRKEKSNITIAVVDEGLLLLTDFQTPDPWKHFFSKERLAVQSYDLYDQVINADKGEIFKRFSIGGDVAVDYRKLQQASERAKRFKPVVLFKGPLETDKYGKVEAKFQMPDYIGAVRIMVVSASGDNYGSAFKNVPVKSDLMVLPYLPRFIAPGDKFSFPVTVFAMKEGIQNVAVEIKASGPVSFSGESKKTLLFRKEGEKEVFFDAEALNEAGVARITVTASSGTLKAEKTIELDVRPSSPRIYETQKFEIKPGEKIDIEVPDKGIAGTNRAKINISKRPNLNINHRIGWLIRYPYGCIEQIVSASFPQLYLKSFMGITDNDKTEIDKNINSTISRLTNYQTPSGGFGYWPGDTLTNSWGSLYAGHFLIEASKLGYHVPENLLSKWKEHTRSQAIAAKDSLLVRSYTVYLLALAGSPEQGAMNQLKEGYLQEMEDRERWLLAAAYKLAGHEKASGEITKNAGIETKEYYEFSNTFGSGLRDKALIMNSAISTGDKKVVEKLFDLLGEHLSRSNWYSTQATGFMLLSVGKYLNSFRDSGDNKNILKGTIVLSDGSKEKFEVTTDEKFTKVLNSFGNKVAVILDQSNDIGKAYISLEWDGIPLVPEICEAKNLYISARFLDEDGYPVSFDRLDQGDRFWVHIAVQPHNDIKYSIEELAVQMMLPSGWEIENTRLSKEQMPPWMTSLKPGGEKYLDIRDDRVMWFFDITPYKRKYEFVAKINAVTAGKFTLPPIVFEAMYDHRYKVCTQPQSIEVIRH
jgi:alpha-2-macroglobulin